MTCDNAANNDVMIRKLEEKVPSFDGAMARSHCFLHITNLVAKSLMWLFDPKQKDLGDVDLAELEGELEDEDAVMIAETNGEVDGEVVEINNVEGWVDDVEVLSDVERRQLQASIRPIRLAVGKVSENTYWRQAVHCLEQLRKLAFKIVHSTTIVLPAWREICHDLELEPRLILRDVSTCWNSCCNMVDVGVDYREAVDGITQCRDLGLTFELSDHEWEVLEELCNVLKVSVGHVLLIKQTNKHFVDSQRCYALLLVRQYIHPHKTYERTGVLDPQSCIHDPCHGSHGQGVHQLCSQPDLFCPNLCCH